MKKYMLVTLVIAFLLVTVGSPCLASTVANTSKKGSLLIFPLIRTDGNVTISEQYETLITIASDYPLGIQLQCVFVLKDQCEDPILFGFDLTANQPVTWRASTGAGLDGGNISGIGTGHVAELKCWAMRFMDDDADATNFSQMSFNHLTGEATLLRTVGANAVGAATYNAWRFAANDPVGTEMLPEGTLTLSGATHAYDACPQALIFDTLYQVPNPHARTYDPGVDNYIVLTPCKQDVTEEGSPTHFKLNAKRWNENESSATGEFCLNCFFADTLAAIQIQGANQTGANALYVNPVKPETTGPCPAFTTTFPAIGVVVKQFSGFLAGPMTATTPTGQGAWDAAWVASQNAKYSTTGFALPTITWEP